LATSQTFLLLASTKRQEEFEVQFVWLREHGKFETTLWRGARLALINANKAYRLRAQSRTVRGNNAGSSPYKLPEKILTATEARSARYFRVIFWRQPALFSA
jgi:hypothetical protein